MLRPTRICTLLCVAILTPAVALAQRELTDIPDPDPELERKTFLVAEGMEVNLYAADPLLAKPVQMNFDAQGRLWIASSEVYPQVKPGQKANDKILVLEDADGDGKAEKTNVFADGLLIPTGVVPDHAGGCYVANSTELIHLADIDGDGKSDQKKIVLSGFGAEDTHHLLHTLRWGPDGCLYMNQSVYIHSHIETPYGVKRLSGGGIWRFRPETLELEVLCYGFVNPWGHHFDRWGQSFATDGAYGEGINYVFPGAVFFSAPNSTRIVAGLNPGSPKHCGLEIVSGRHMPADWDGNMITCDFRAHRVCRFIVTEDNSGYASRQETEVLKTQHVAFRPIDAKMGPDGALYIADWYNPIIQHGEVDFRDQRRDHTHGRIWRVTAKGRPTLKTAIKQDANPYELMALLKEPEEWTRQAAKIMLKHRRATEVNLDVMLQRWMAGLDQGDPNYEHHLLEALWVCECTDDSSLGLGLLQDLAKSRDHRVRAAVVRVASHWRTRLDRGNDRFCYPILQAAARDQHPRVRLEGVRGLAMVGTPEAASDAAYLLARPMDRFLDFALWQALRDLAPAWLPAVKEGKDVFGGDVERLTFALKAVSTPEVVPPLLKLIQENKLPATRVDDVLGLIAQLGGTKELGAIFEMVVDPKSPLALARKKALLDSLAETSRVRRVVPAGDLNRLSGSILTSSNRVMVPSVYRAAGVWKLESLREGMTSDALSSKAPAEIRVAAIEGLSSLGGDSSKQALGELGSGEKTLALRQQAIGAVAALDVQLAAQLTMKLLAESPAGVDPAAAIAPLLANQNGAPAMTAALKDAKLPPDTAKLVLRAVRASPQPSEQLIAAVQNAGGLEAAVWKLTSELTAELVREVKEKGNPVRGESIYRRGDLQCMKCHSIGGAGGVVGADLVSIGASAQVDYVIESLIAPSAKIKEGYHARLILDDAGQQITGILVREDGQQIVLRTAEDKLVTLAKSSIEQMKDSPRSLMPDGAADALTRSELIDLVRFLSELGKVGGKYTIGPKRLVRRWQVLTWTHEAHTLLRRTSYDSAATDNADLFWDSAYSQVDGELPLDALPAFVIQGQPATRFVRAELDVSTAGKIRLLVSTATGNQVSLWVDGKPTPLAGRVASVDLGKGRHVLTLSVGTLAQVNHLTVELQNIPGSSAQVQIVGGK